MRGDYFKSVTAGSVNECERMRWERGAGTGEKGDDNGDSENNE